MKQDPHPPVREACALCGARRITVRYDLGEHRIVRCSECSLMWLDPRPTESDLQAVYDDSYFRNARFFDGVSHLYGYYDYFEERFRRQSAYVGLIREIKRRLPGFVAGQSRLLDIGCGLGYLLDVAHDEGFQVAGVEFNRAAAERLKAKYVFPVYAGDILAYRDSPYEVVTMMDVVEHLLDPLASMEHIADLVMGNGLLVLTTMDSDGLASRLLGRRLEDFRRVREHLHFFTRRSVRALLERNGFEVLTMRFYGHHFRLAFLAHRVRLAFPLVGAPFEMVVTRLRLEQLSVYVNPCTKMIVFARRRA